MSSAAKIADNVRRAYARTDYWDERVVMMNWSAEKCDELQRGGDNVSAFRVRTRVAAVACP